MFTNIKNLPLTGGRKLQVKVGITFASNETVLLNYKLCSQSTSVTALIRNIDVKSVTDEWMDIHTVSIISANAYP